MRPAALGFALQRALDEGRDVLDPLMAAKIAIECAGADGEGGSGSVRLSA